MNDLSIWNQFVRRPEWFDDAACRTLPPATFFPNSNNENRPESRDETAAKTVCADCPVRVDCLAFGLEERFGIWGGRTPRERRRIRRIGRSSVA